VAEYTQGSPYKVKMARKPVKPIGTFAKQLRSSLPNSPTTNK